MYVLIMCTSVSVNSRESLQVDCRVFLLLIWCGYICKTFTMDTMDVYEGIYNGKNYSTAERKWMKKLIKNMVFNIHGHRDCKHSIGHMLEEARILIGFLFYKSH